MQPNLEDAHQFANIVLDNEPTEFRLFHDTDKENNATIPMWGALSQLENALVNFNQKGYGVHVVINKADEKLVRPRTLGKTIDGKKKGTLKEHVTAVRALFVDLDGQPLPSSWDLAPDIVVESSPGKFHVYWAVKPDDPLPLADFEGVQKRLIEVYKGDPQVWTLNHTMRMPGFIHQKGEPFLSRVVSTDAVWRNAA